MSKLIVNTGTLMAGGAERVLSILSTPFANAYDSVEYILWLDAKYPDVFYKIDPRVKITKISKESGSRNILHHLYWFRKHIKKEKPDAILSFMVMINFSVMLSQLFCNTPMYLAERNDPRYFAGNQLLRRIINWMYSFPNVKKIIMQTENNKNFFSKRLRKKVEVIYNPIEMEDFYVGCAISQKKKNKIVTVSRLEKQKHQHILVSAFSEFHKIHPDYTLTFYGIGSRKDALEQQAKNLGISKNVFFPGRVVNVCEAIKDADMFIMTSEYEGMSNSLIEAMCLGLPCISTKVSGATDLIENDVNGVLIDIDDTKALIKEMNKIVVDTERAKIISLNAIKIYEQLRADKISKKWIECIS